jgi:16S rRNA (guanine527-N7)-methyltransferase
MNEPVHNVSRETMDNLHRYQALLNEWQEMMNLVARSTLPQAWERHFEDSLQMIPLLPAGPATLVDLGSGAGFPGLVIAMARPDIKVHLVESTGKKCRFLETVSRETNTPITIHNERIESMTGLVRPDIITARALANLSKLLDYCAPWIKANPAVSLIFMKGVQADAEVAEARKHWAFDLSEQPSRTENGAKILTLTHVRRGR